MCADCRERKPTQDFRRRNQTTERHLRDSYCRQCRKRRDRERVFRRKHGFSRAEHAELLQAQGGRCHRCGSDTPHGPSPHAQARRQYFLLHEDGEGRHLVCFTCRIQLDATTSPGGDA
jgi:hypothetical protein